MIVKGVTMPDIPADVLASYPNIVIMTSSAGNTTAYLLLAANAAIGKCAGSVIGSSWDEMILSAGAGVAYGLSDDGTEWEYNTSKESGGFFFQLGDTGSVTTEVVWANHDIYELTSVDTSTGSFTVGGIYYTKTQEVIVGSVRLPDIPGDLLAKYPKVMILHAADTMSEAYFLYAAPAFFSVIAGSILGMSYDTVVGTLTAGTAYICQAGDASWTSRGDFAQGGGILPLGETDAGNYSLVWANHDIFEITALNLTTGDYNSGRMYFRDSNDPLPARIDVPGSFLKNFADYIREWLSGMAAIQRFGFDSLQNVLPWLKPIEQTVSGFTSDSGCYKAVCQNVLLLNLITVHQYIVNFDGFRYYGAATLHNDDGTLVNVFGNRNLIGVTETVTHYSKMPFCIVEKNGSTEIYTSASGESHTISVVYLADID